MANQDKKYNLVLKCYLQTYFINNQKPNKHSLGRSHHDLNPILKNNQKGKKHSLGRWQTCRPTPAQLLSSCGLGWTRSPKPWYFFFISGIQTFYFQVFCDKKKNQRMMDNFYSFKFLIFSFFSFHICPAGTGDTFFFQTFPRSLLKFWISLSDT